MASTAERSDRGLLLGAALATAALGAALARRVPVGIPGEWVWRPNQLELELGPAGWAGLALVVVAWFATRAGWWTKLSAARRAAALALLMAASFAMQVGLLNATGLPWITPGAIIASPVATTYYSVSLDVRDPAEWVASYPERMASLPYHARTHPPGFVLLFVGLRRLCEWALPQGSPALSTIAESYRVFGIGPSATDAAAAMAGAFLFALIGALSLGPLYLLTRDLAGAEVGICAAALMAAMPSMLLFGASSDQVALTFAVLTLWLAYSAWQRGCPVRALLAGLTLAVGLFFTLGLLILVAWLVVWAGLGVVRSANRGAAMRRALMGAGAAALGFVACYGVLYVTLRYRPIAVAQAGLFAHRGVTTIEVARSYWKWILIDPVELAIFAGLPAVAAALWSVRGVGSTGLHTFLVSWLVTVAMLDLSGTVRGEVGRIWLFLLWPVALAGAARLAERPRRAMAIAMLVALQVWQTLLMRGYLTLYDIF